MSTTSQIKSQLLKFSLILTLVLLVLSESHLTMAQGLKKFVRTYQVGFEGSFGIKSFQLASNIAEIDGLDVRAEGGSFGIMIGARALRAKLKQGYYYSSSSVTQTVDDIKSAGIINFYPLRLSSQNNSKFQPYLLMGVERNTFKMYGAYGLDQTKPRNYSVSEAPYLGKIATLQASMGAGMEYRIQTPGHYVSLFAEAKYGKSIKTISSSSIFSDTNTSNQLVINIGVGFGYNR